jgi:hypothetical protein
LVIDWTTTGAVPPTITPPTSTPTDLRRAKGEEKYPVMAAGRLCSSRSTVHPSAGTLETSLLFTFARSFTEIKPPLN